MKTEIKPIRTEADHAAALREIQNLLDAKDGTPESDRLDVLATLVDAYEEEHYPMDPPDPIEAILFRLGQMGLTKKDLEPLIGSRGRVTEILSRKRNLSIEMIRRISDELHISTDVLIKPTRTLSGRPARTKASIKISSVHQRKKTRSAMRAKLTARSSSSGSK